MGDQNSKGACSCSDPIYDEEDHPPQQKIIHHFDILNQMEYSTETKKSQNNNRELQSTKKISQFQVEQTQREQMLILKVIASATLQDGLEFIIGPNGLDNQNNSNAVFFGCKYKNQRNGYRINNIKIPCFDKKLGEKNRGQHFYIKYNHPFYKIKDLGLGFGCFHKIDTVQLRNNSLITVGQLYFTTQICYGQDLLKLPSFNNLYDVKEFIVCGYPCDRQYFLQQHREQHYLRIQCYGGVAKDDVYILASNNYLPVTLGRNIDCLIRYYDDDFLSKYQCTIIFEDGNWKVQDGIDGKRSMNGTWLYIDSEINIENRMLIKVNNTILETHLI